PASTSVGGASVRGKADTARSLSDLAGPRVFETYKSDWETFPPQAGTPLDWNTYAPTATVCSNAPAIAPGTLGLGSLNKFGNMQEGGVDGMLTHVLVGQNGKLVRYLAGFNEDEFKVILAGKLYDASKVPDQADRAIALAAKAPSGAITIKSAWIEMEGLAVQPSTFYTRRALLQDPMSGTCQEATVGLVGLHIVRKTTTSPQWIWASFEHVSNVPSQGEPPAASYVFNDGSGSAMANTAPSGARNPLVPGWVVPAPFNVERKAPISSEMKSVNAAWHASLAAAG